MTTSIILSVMALVSQVVTANDNGVALTPPLGWRSWNLYGGSMTQEKMISIMDGVAAKRWKLVRQDINDNYDDDESTDTLVSLCDIGYCDVGLDDVWQDCNTQYAAEGMHYHDQNGYPIVNKVKFPSMVQMTNYGHAFNLTVGWYANNCACSDHCRNVTECTKQITGDVQALLEYKFDSLKIDGCGNETNLTLWDEILRQHSSNNKSTILVENCHGPNPDYKPTNRSLPPNIDCPYNMYRTSVDIRNNYGSILHNLLSVEYYHARNLSYPGCWAYPDMLQVGVRQGLNEVETKSHFNSWAIVSSPLILSHDVNNVTLMNTLVWPIISNQEVLHVNQVYYGDSGGIYDQSNVTISIPITLNEMDGNDNDNENDDSPIGATSSSSSIISVMEAPTYLYLYKPLSYSRDKVAILLMNCDERPQELVANFANVPGLDCCCCSSSDGDCNGKEEEKEEVDEEDVASTSSSDCSCCCTYHVRDISNHVDLGYYHKSWSVVVEPHDSAFIVVEKKKQPIRLRRPQDDGAAFERRN